MQTLTSMSSQAQPITSTGCCPPFDPRAWEGKEIVWLNKPFVHDHVTSFLHMPLNMGRKVTNAMRLIEAAHAAPEHPLMLTEEHSPWSSELFIDVTRPVPNAEVRTMSGTFLTKVFEGPYADAGRWMESMKRYVADQGRELEKIYFGYTTCPSCAKAYGKNYVVLFAKVDDRATSDAKEAG